MKLKKGISILIIAVFVLSQAVMATGVAKTFSDVPQDFWAATYIAELSKAGVISGYTDGTFKPNTDVTRAEWAKMLCVAAGIDVSGAYTEDVEDVNESDWFADYVCKAIEYVPAYWDETYTKVQYAPQVAITREDVAVSIVAAKKYIIELADASVIGAFSDNGDLTEGFEPYIAVAVEKGLVLGYEDNTFRPQNSLTRAEAATLLYRAFYTGDNEAVDQSEDKEKLAGLAVQFNEKLAVFDRTVLDLVAPDSIVKESVEVSLDLDSLVSAQVEAVGLPEKYDEELTEILRKVVVDMLSSTETKVESVVIDGDAARVVADVSMLEPSNIGEADLLNLIGEEKIAETTEKTKNMTEEEQGDYILQLIIDVLPEAYEQAREEGQRASSTQTFIFEKLDGKWLVVTKY